MMKHLLILCAWLGFTAATAVAQVTVDIVFEQELYLPNEPLVAKVRINNASGQTLRLGEGQDWLQIVVESNDGNFVSQVRPLDIVGGFSVESSHTAIKRVDLAPHYDLTKIGRYKTVATVQVPAFRTSFASQGKSFYIGSGSRLWETTFGVPDAGGEAKEGLPETRKYLLVQVNQVKEIRLYVRVTDQNERNLRVLAIGPLVSFSRPEPQLDRWSNLHILYQTGARSFNYSVVTPEGLLMTRETHDYTDTRPTLRVGAEGKIAVGGGLRRISNTDIPPAEPAEEIVEAATDAKPPAP